MLRMPQSQDLQNQINADNNAITKDEGDIVQFRIQLQTVMELLYYAQLSHMSCAGLHRLQRRVRMCWYRYRPMPDSGVRSHQSRFSRFSLAF